MKKLTTVLICIVLVISALALSSCNIISDLNNAVKYPDSYLLSYEITSDDGIVSTVTKAVDEDGNVYYMDTDKESIYILDGSSYIRYEKKNGEFVKTSGAKLTKTAMENETKAINTYAEKSKDSFMPTAKQESDTEMLGRSCKVYKLGVGNENTGSYTYYYVDSETGICLGTEVKNTALGNNVAYNGKSFICTEFYTENVPAVSKMIVK